LPLWRSRLLVTPAFHREHHTHPHANFAHVFSVLGTLAGTRLDSDVQAGNGAVFSVARNVSYGAVTKLYSPE